MNITAVLDAIGGCVHEIAVSHGLTLSLFTAGLVGGATHCSAMCGPFVLSQLDQKKPQLEHLSGRLLIPYHMGRITTYAVMAMLLASVLNAAFLFLPVRAFVVAPLLVSAGFVFLLTAFPSAGRYFPWLMNVRMSIPYTWIEGHVRRLSGSDSVLKQYGLGVLLGFLPCGLIVAALMAASSAPSTAQAGLAMAAFGVGTMPALILVALGGRALQARYPRFMQGARRALMVWSSLLLFAMAGLMFV